MGVLDLPAPLFAGIDAALGTVLGATARLMVWGAVAGVASMLLYRLVSPQARIAGMRAEADRARQALAGFDDEMAEAWPLMRRMLALSLRQVALVLGPAVVASLPALSLIVWASTAYGYGYPPATAPVAVAASPAALAARWEDNGDTPHVVVRNGRGQVVADVTVTAPVPVLHPRRWWNVLIGNPGGYLPRDAAVERVEIALPAREYWSVGPGWLRGWAATFFTVLVLASLAVKRALRVY